MTVTIAGQDGVYEHDYGHEHEHDVNATSTRTPRILLVSAMFPLPDSKSKHTGDEYAAWLGQFLDRVTTDVYFFTSEAFAPHVQSASAHRGSAGRVVIDTTYTSPFDIPPLTGKEHAYGEMHAMDREGFRHSPELYAVWNAKPFLLDLAVKKLTGGGEYDYAFWNDAGSFRNWWHMYRDWPDPRRVDSIWETASKMMDRQKEDLLFFPFTGMYDRSAKRWKEDQGPIDLEVSQGSFFGGSPKTIHWWSRTFYAYHDQYLDQHLFVGKDQTLINALLLLFADRVITVFYRDPWAPAHASFHPFGYTPYFDKGYLGACGGEWWYYQFWLAGRKERDEMRELWLGWLEEEQGVKGDKEKNRWWTGWRWKWLGGWEWYRERQTCRLTGVLPLQGLLEREFGDGWVPPERKLKVEL